MIRQKIREIRNGELSAEENIKNFIFKIKREDSKINSILYLNENAIRQSIEADRKIKNGTQGKLAGLGFIVKSNINVRGMICNCASKTLENYKSGYNATIIEKLLKEDAIVIGMANMDEFAAGSSGESSAFGPTRNPVNLELIPGGSSSGSAAALASGFCDFALGSDTGGSIRNPASHCGIVGFKPSYGFVSRYGLIDLSMSLDQIGTLTKNVEDSQIIFDLIKGRDKKDAVSRDFSTNIKKINRIGILKTDADKKILEKTIGRVMEVCREKKYIYNEVKLEHVNLGIQTYYPIVYVEFFSGTRKFDGRKYGYKIEETCGTEVLRRIFGGEEISKEEFAGRYYRKALSAKKIIEREFEDAFKKFDIIVLPTVPRLPHKFGDKISIDDMYNYDVLTVLANLAEIPAISIPCGHINNIPVGLQIMAARGNDNLLLEIAREFE